MSDQPGVNVEAHAASFRMENVKKKLMYDSDFISRGFWLCSR